MKFKKGGKAGSLSKKAIPSGVYHRRKVDNRDTVDVRFYEHTNNQDIKEATFRNAVRRYPPPTDGLGSWNAGDVVEVLDGDCWKTATVLKAMCGCYYLVKIIGSARELRLHKVNIRVHQLWQNGKWVIVGKGSGSCEDRVSNKAPNMSCYQKIRSQGGNAENNTGFQESCIVSARTSKRTSPFWSSELEGYTERVRKIRSIEKEGGHEHFVEKVDAVAYPRENLGEIRMRAPPTNQTTGSYDLERGTPNFFHDSLYARSLEPNDSDIDACSVGSCSVFSNSPCKLFSNYLAGSSTDEDTTSSTAESFYGAGNKEEKFSLPLGEDVATRIHRLELHAYRCTLGVLYASGSLSWEQEALLTNLRISLNISNDEHLMELRNLISTGASIHIR